MNTGGPVTWQGVMIFANLIPDKMPTISTILNTAYDASMVVWTIFNVRLPVHISLRPRFLKRSFFSPSASLYNAWSSAQRYVLSSPHLCWLPGFLFDR
jgi:hypothetical protein